MSIYFFLPRQQSSQILVIHCVSVSGTLIRTPMCKSLFPVFMGNQFDPLICDQPLYLSVPPTAVIQRIKILSI